MFLLFLFGTYMLTQEEKKERQRQRSQTYYQNNKEAHAARNKAWVEANPEAWKAIHKKSREKDWVHTRLNTVRHRAKSKGYEFNLTDEYLRNLVVTHCPVFGMELIYGNASNNLDNNAQLDRIDNDKGYIRGNVHFISQRANRIKNDSTIAELEILLDYLKSLGPD